MTRLSLTTFSLKLPYWSRAALKQAYLVITTTNSKKPCTPNAHLSMINMRLLTGQNQATLVTELPKYLVCVPLAGQISQPKTPKFQNFEIFITYDVEKKFS